jgi:hypothetical protein
MDPELIKRILAATPAFNQSIANGLAVEHMMSINPETGKNSTMAYIDRLIHINKALLPEGLVYEGSSIQSPMKHFEEITREYQSKRIANIAKYDVYLVKYEFSYRGEKLFPRYVLLPFVRPGGLINLNGALYNIAPVLTDVGYSVLRGSIFIPFRRTKLTFNRTDHHFYTDGRRTIIYVIWSMVHNEMSNRTKRDLDNRRKIESCLAHYFFCKFGVTGAFKQWGKADLLIGNRTDFNEANYPRAQWTIYESVTLKGRHPSGDICLVIPKAQETEFIKMLVGGFFYVMDTFPDRFADAKGIDDPVLWQTILGHMVFGDFEHGGKVLENIETHLHGFNNSLDEMTIEELSSAKVYVSNIWELLYEIMTSLSHNFYQSSHDETSMYNKRLVVLRYVMEEFNYSISLFAYGFQSRRDKEWTINELNEALKRTFKLNTCIRKLTSEHGELDTVNFPGDNMMLRITSMLVPQDRARKSRGHNKGLIGDTSRLLHASIAEVGQYKNQPKNNPDGRARINPYVQVGIDGMVERRPELVALIDKTQRRLSR